MTPRFTLPNHTNGCSGNSELSSYLSLKALGLPDCQNISLRELRHPMSRSPVIRDAGSPFDVSICIIVGARSQEKMIDVYALPIVAVVTDDHPIGDLSIVSHPRNTMGIVHTAIPVDLSVSVFKRATDKENAAASIGDRQLREASKEINHTRDDNANYMESQL